MTGEHLEVPMEGRPLSELIGLIGSNVAANELVYEEIDRRVDEAILAAKQQQMIVIIDATQAKLGNPDE